MNDGDVQSLVMNWRSAMLGVTIFCTGIVLACLNAQQTERRAVLWLTAFVSAGAVTAIPMVIGFAGAYDRWPGLTFLPTQMTLLFGPLIFFHARTLMRAGPLGRWRWLLAPGVIYWLYQLCAFLFLGDYKAKWAYNDAIHEPIILPAVFFTGLGLTGWALVQVWRVRREYLVWLENNRSDDDRFRPVWLTHFIFIGVPLMAIWAFENILGRVLGFNYFERFWAGFASLFLLFFLSLEALARLNQPFPKMDRPQTRSPHLPLPDPNSTTLSNERDWRAEGERLSEKVVENSWHLEASLTLIDLSRRVGMNQTYASRALNQGLGVSFSLFINKLRVDHAKNLIRREQGSMLEIALASGFGSKASFNRSFKLHSGQTPSAYRDAASMENKVQ
ncbi:MAG: helix-turn-helix transcriptional regulator [Marinicaulis sp.]|nr:helix-turn-helix transcriptional regulator [Marinicaulis sp.]